MTKSELLEEIAQLRDTQPIIQGETFQQGVAHDLEMYIKVQAGMTSAEGYARILYGLTDLTLRDYLMGLVIQAKDQPLTYSQISELVNVAPAKYVKAPRTILALLNYLNGNTTTAAELLRKCSNYQLATLLQRTMVAKLEPDAFSVMADQLQPKVKASIFGGDNE